MLPRDDLAGEGRAVIVGGGLGADAEYIAGLGYDTTAFDISPSAVQVAKERHPPGSPVRYVVADLLDPPSEWVGAFDLVVDVFTVQALPPGMRREATESVARLVAPGGRLIVITAIRDGDDPVDGPPWPLSRAEIEAFATDGLTVVQIEDTNYPDRPEARRWRATFRREP